MGIPEIDRRRFLAGAGAGLALAGLPARAAPVPFSLKHGMFEINVVSDGHLVLPINFLAANVPEAELIALLKSAGQPTDQLRPATNVTVIRAASNLIAVDAGSGAHFMETAGKLPDNLEAAGIDRTKVTKVVFTHGHPDHLWGTIDDFDELTFPNASYYVSAAEWNFWMGADVLTKLPAERQGFATGAQRSLARIKDRLTMVKPGDDIVLGVRAVDTGGHTQGHISLEIAGGEGVMVLGDALTHAVVSFAHPDWRPQNDHEPERAVATRRRLLDRLAGDHTQIVGFHLPYPGVGTVERKDGAYRFVPEA